jgi:hypothetical protein
LRGDSIGWPERYHAFIAALGRRLSKGPTLLREVSVDVAGHT